MAILNNLLLSKEPKTDIGAAVAEAMDGRQPGDKLKITLEVTVVENLGDRSSYDVDSVDFGSGDSDAGSESETEDIPETPEKKVVAQGVLAAMSKKATSAKY
jgi:hypothetical protein